MKHTCLLMMLLVILLGCTNSSATMEDASNNNIAQQERVLTKMDSLDGRAFAKVMREIKKGYDLSKTSEIDRLISTEHPRVQQSMTLHLERGIKLYNINKYLLAKNFDYTIFPKAQKWGYTKAEMNKIVEGLVLMSTPVDQLDISIEEASKQINEFIIYEEMLNAQKRKEGKGD